MGKENKQQKPDVVEIAQTLLSESYPHINFNEPIPETVDWSDILDTICDAINDIKNK